jgi:hypothetical protein
VLAPPLPGVLAPPDPADRPPLPLPVEEPLPLVAPPDPLPVAPPLRIRELDVSPPQPTTSDDIKPTADAMTRHSLAVVVARGTRFGMIMKSLLRRAACSTWKFTLA